MRTDSASRSISATPHEIYLAFAVPGAMERWLPPEGMSGEMIRFDFRNGGSYLMRLSYLEAGSGQGKTTADADEVEVRLIRIDPDRSIEQEVTFASDDPSFAGIMRMIWTFQAEGDSTLVSVRAENVPPGISAEDHEAGLMASLDNLAAFVEGR